ncbi:MAG TPA: lipoyl(octanoyl) transferase LipB [Acidisarcina sp.]
MITYLYLGRQEYSAALELQRQMVELRHAGRVGNVLLMLEHPPVLTLGRNSRRDNILATDAELSRRGVTLHEINRGGDVTYHGPGQLVGYPIFDLRSFSPRLGAVDYVRLMEEALIRTCLSYGVFAQRIAGRTGVWTGGWQGASSLGTAEVVAGVAERKIAAIGIHISRGITSHGFALNLTVDLRDFELIVPCGIADRGVTSLDLEMDTSAHALPALEEAANEVARQFGRVFGEQVLRFDSIEDLLIPSARTVSEARPAIPGLDSLDENSNRMRVPDFDSPYMPEKLDEEEEWLWA